MTMSVAEVLRELPLRPDLAELVKKFEEFCKTAGGKIDKMVAAGGTAIILTCTLPKRAQVEISLDTSPAEKTIGLRAGEASMSQSLLPATIVNLLAPKSTTLYLYERSSGIVSDKEKMVIETGIIKLEIDKIVATVDIKLY